MTFLIKWDINVCLLFFDKIKLSCWIIRNEFWPTFWKISDIRGTSLSNYLCHFPCEQRFWNFSFLTFLPVSNSKCCIFITISQECFHIVSTFSNFMCRTYGPIIIWFRFNFFWIHLGKMQCLTFIRAPFLRLKQSQVAILEKKQSKNCINMEKNS